MNNEILNALSRRRFLKQAAVGSIAARPVAVALLGGLAASRAIAENSSSPLANVLRQSSSDLGDGTYQNPVIMAGDIADLSVVRDGKEYYLVHGCGVSPGFIIWRSRDLINWEPAKKLRTESGPGGPDLSKCGTRYYLYYTGDGTLKVMYASHPLGPWSEPTSLGIEPFDATHIVTPDGRRYILTKRFLVRGTPPTTYIYELAADGLSVIEGSERKFNYEGWPIPSEWDISGFSLEGWNTFQRNGYIYVLAAEGGTAGPAAGHMCVAARARTLDGPWENSPYNPIINADGPEDGLWSKGQGTIVETLEGEYFMIYHAYLKDATHLGRQVCMKPLEWTEDGWFRVPEGIRGDRPIPKPRGGEPVPHGFLLSDDFRGPELDVKWGFPVRSCEGRYRFVKDGIALKGDGKTLAEGVPMVMPVPSRDFEFFAEMTIPAGVVGGIAVYNKNNIYTGIRLEDGIVQGQSLVARTHRNPSYEGKRIFFRMVVQDAVARLYFGSDGKEWTRLESSFDVSMYNRATFGGVGGVRPALYACGDGEVIVHQFRLKELA